MSESHWTRENIHFGLKVLVPVAVLLVLMALWGQQVSSVISPFLVAFLLTYMFNPIVTFLEGRQEKQYRMRRVFGVTLLFLALMLVVAGGCLILVKIIEEIIVFGEHIPLYSSKLYHLIETYFLSQLDRVPPEQIDWIREQLQGENLKLLFLEYIKPQMQEADLAEGVESAAKGLGGVVRIAFMLLAFTFSKIVGGAGSILSSATQALLILVITFYLLLDYERLLRKIQGLIPDLYRERTLSILHRIDLQLSGFLRGQMMICLCIGTLTSIGLMIVGVQYAFLIGMLAGLFNIIPYLGPALGAFCAVSVTILDEIQGISTDLTQPATEALTLGINWGQLGSHVGAVFIVFGLVQSIDAFWLSPKIMGEKLDLHPMIILFALLLGGTLFGVVGMLIAVPIACIVRVLIEDIYFPSQQPSV